MAGARIRWWPVPAILAAGAVAVAAIQASGEHNRQEANVQSLMVGAAAVGLAGLWLLLFARLPARARWALLVAGAAAPALFLAGFRVRGVTGDLLPIFEWRFGAAAAPPPETGGAPLAATLPHLADYPQFFGPARDGVLGGPELARDWSERPPRLLWRRPIGAGWSGFAVAGQRAVTLEQHGADEAAVCYDVASGAAVWSHRYAARFDDTVAGVGPRTTPTIDGERDFALGATGLLHCLDLRTGRVLWKHDVLAEHGAPQPEWGVAGSPLVAGNLLVVSAGGSNGRSLVAYDKASGAFAWGGGSDRAHYSSPRLATLGGAEQILIFNAAAVAAHDPADGRVLWTYPWKQGHPHVAQPVAAGPDQVLISSGYGTGCHLVRIARSPAGWSATTAWRSLGLKAKFSNAVARGGHVYGLDDGILVCLDLQTGERRWKRGRYGHGQMILVRDLLLITTEAGEVVLVATAPDEPRELTRFAALDGKTWNPPALAGAYLLVRNDREAACYRLPLAGE